MPHGAVALAAVLCAGAPAGASVSVVNLSWQFYQGGMAQQDAENVVVLQDMYSNVAHNEVSQTLGGATFTSIASISSTTLHGSQAMVFSSIASLAASAQTPAVLPDGMAEAFAGLSAYDVTFEVVETPHLYLGAQVLHGKDNAFPGGSVLQPGLYSFLYLNTFGLDAHAVAAPGQDLSDEGAWSFRFEFQPVPAPAAAPVLALGAYAATRRRRPR